MGASLRSESVGPGGPVLTAFVGVERADKRDLVSAEQGTLEIETNRLDELAVADHRGAEEEAQARGVVRARCVAQRMRHLVELDRMCDQRNAEQLLALLLATHWTELMRY